MSCNLKYCPFLFKIQNLIQANQTKKLLKTLCKENLHIQLNFYWGNSCLSADEGLWIIHSNLHFGVSILSHLHSPTSPILTWITGAVFNSLVYSLSNSIINRKHGKKTGWRNSIPTPSLRPTLQCGLHVRVFKFFWTAFFLWTCLKWLISSHIIFSESCPGHLPFLSKAVMLTHFGSLYHLLLTVVPLQHL